jgi:acetyl-CoA carboxylase carboxyltransferase component
MATGEVVDAEVLGGAETHAKLTGLADQLAVDEYVHWQAIIDGIGRLMLDRIDAIRKAREWVTALPSPIPQQLPNLESQPPRYSAEDLLYLVDPDIRKPFNMEEVILRLVDDSRFSAFKPCFGTSLMTGFAQIFGRHSLFISVEL